MRKNVTEKYPQKVKEMEKIFWAEAKKYQVLPLDSSVATRLVTPRPSITARRNVFMWTVPLAGTPNGDARQY
jgi:arylsulfatase